MIRATRAGLIDRVGDQQRTNSARLRRWEEVATTGLAINRPSDAPERLYEAHNMSKSAANQAQWGSNAGDAASHLQAMDQALTTGHDIIVRARELAVQMAGETVGAAERAAAAVEVRELQQSMLATANITFNDRYLFAGWEYDQPAFDSTFVYQGDANEPEARVGESRYIRVGLDGSQVFQGTVDIFGTLENLAVALETNDQPTTFAQLDDLSAAVAQLSTWQGVVGSEQAAAEDAVAVTESMKVLFSDRLSDLIEADPVVAYMELGEAQNAYNATLRVAASTSTTSLLDLLG